MTGGFIATALPDGRPPPRSKLEGSVWLHAASLYEHAGGKVRLRTLCSECGISHRTAWRMREYFRDVAAFSREREQRAAHNPALHRMIGDRK